jgi:hypothetical protein
MSKKKTYRDSVSGEKVSKEYALANKDTTQSETPLHPFTHAFENIRKGEKEKAVKIVKNMSETEVKTCAEIIKDFHALLALRDLIEQGD